MWNNGECSLQDIATDITGCEGHSKRNNINSIDTITEEDFKRFSEMVFRVVRHFKNKDYYVMGLARHTETNELMVLYKALYGKNKNYVRPFKMFMSKVDKIKYPKVIQKYRIELKEKQ